MKALALICAMTLTPAECTPETAKDLSYVQGRHPITAHDCQMLAQAMLAQTRLAKGPNFVKIICEEE